MQLLTPVRDVDDVGRRPGLDAVLGGGKVGAGVIETAIGLLDEKWIGMPFAVSLGQEGIVLGRQFPVRKNGPAP